MEINRMAKRSSYRTQNTCVRIIAVLLMLLLCIAMITPAYGAENNGHGNAWVYDEARVVSDDTEEYIANLNETVFANYKNKPQLAFMIINDLPYDMNKYKLDMFNEYGVGTKEENRGMLFVFAINNRKYGLEIGDGFKKGSLLRKDLETDLITSEMKRSLQSGDYDTVVKQVAEHLAQIMADEENGIYLQKEHAATAQAAAKAAQRKAAREALQAKVKAVGLIVVNILIAATIVVLVFEAIKYAYDVHKSKEAMQKMLLKYTRNIQLLGPNADNAAHQLKQYCKGKKAEFIEKNFAKKLNACFLRYQYAEIEKIGNPDRLQLYKKSCKRRNDFLNCKIIDPTIIIHDVDVEEQAKAEMVEANKRLVAEFLEKNDARIENRNVVDELHTCFQRFHYDDKQVSESEMEQYFSKIMSELNFKYEFDRFCKENADKINPQYFDKGTFYKEIQSTDQYAQYHYDGMYNINWMLHFLMIHMAHQKHQRELARRLEEERRQEEERIRQAEEQRQQQESLNSSFGSNFGGGSSSGGGFSGGW